MFTQAEMIDTLQKTAQSRFPEYPVQVRPSMDEAETLCVYVFCVDPKRVDVVDDAIFALQEKLCPGEEYLFLPMIKTLEVTRQYYPEFLGKIRLSETGNSAAAWVFVKRSEWLSGHSSSCEDALSILLQARGPYLSSTFFDNVFQQFMRDSNIRSISSMELLTAFTTRKMESKVEMPGDCVNAETGFASAA